MLSTSPYLLFTITYGQLYKDINTPLNTFLCIILI